MCMCKKCMTICGTALIVLGFVFLLVDFGHWGFWNIKPWTALFILAGIGCVASSKCPDCDAARSGKKGKA